MTPSPKSALAILTTTVLAFAGLVASASPAYATPSSSVNISNVVNPGNRNASAIFVSISGLPDVYGAKLTFAGVTITEQNGSWNPISTFSGGFFTNCFGTSVGISTAVDVAGSCNINQSANWSAGGTKSVGGLIRFRFPANSLQFASSGPYTITPSYNGTDLSAIILQPATIAQSALSITSISSTFGTPLALTTSGGSSGGAVTYTVANGTSTTGCSISAGVLSSTSAGTCLVTATMAGNATYSAVSSAQTSVSIARASRTLSFTATSMTIAYGNTDTVLANPSVGSGDGAVTYSAGDSSACSVNSSSGAVLATSASGTCSITATIAEGTNHLTASTTIPVTVTAATRPLTVTAGSASINFGTTYAINALANSSSGLSGLDVVSGATFIYTGTGSTSYGPTAVMPANAGTYSVTASAATFSPGSAANNYSITYAAGGVTISRVSRTIAFATTSANLTFGSTVTVSASASLGDGAVTYSTSSSGCSVDVSSGVVTATGNSGTCTISASVAQGTNHLTASTTTQFTVTLAKRAITVDVPDLEAAFGDSVSPTRDLTVGTLVGSDAISGVTYTYAGSGSTTYASSTTAPTAAGTYTVTPSVAVFSTGDVLNYNLSYTPGTLTITKRAMTIKASNVSIVVKSAVSPTYTITSGSLLSGNAISGVTYTYAGSGSTTYASSTVAPTAIGTYTITPSVAVFSTGNSSNYLLTYSAGTLTIAKNAITITTSTLNIASGATVSPSYSITAGSLLSGDAISGVTYRYRGIGSVSYALSTTAPTASGVYELIASDVVFSTGVLSNYEITFTDGTLTIQAPPAPAPSASSSPTPSASSSPTPSASSSPSSGTTTAATPGRPVAPPAVSNQPVGSISNAGASSSGRAMVGGVAVTPRVESPSSRSTSVQVGAMQIGVSLDEGANGQARVAAGESGLPELHLPAGNASTMSGKGLFPGSTLQIWLGGNGSSRELARIPVAPDGSYNGQVVFAAGVNQAPMALGRQVIQMSGFDTFGNQTVVDMVITIAQGPVVPEVMRDTGTRPSLSFGQFMATSGGADEPVEAQVAADGSSISFAGDTWSFGLGNTGINFGGSNQAPEISFLEGGSATFQATGLMPGTTASVWFFSDPVLAGSAEVAEDGSLSIDFRVDSAFVSVGEHTLQLQGVAGDGFIVAVNWGVAVEESSSFMDNTILWIVGSLAVVALVAGIFVARRRRLSN